MAASAEMQPVEDRNLDRTGKSWTAEFTTEKQIKSAENKQRVLGVFILKLISVRSGQGLQPASSLSVPAIQPMIIPSLSISLGPTAPRPRL